MAIEDGDDKSSVMANCTFKNLSEIPTFLPADSVMTLDLSNNRLKALHNESFTMYVNLMTIIISYNEIKYVKLETFSRLYHLTEVDLSYNELEYIPPDTFSNNLKLHTVSLAGNPLVTFPMDSPALISPSLTSLDLRSCSLMSVHEDAFSSLPKLAYLDLMSNHMQVIPRKSLEVLEGLRVVELRNNRWQCSCEMREVMQWTSSLRPLQYPQRPIKCFEKGEYKTLWSLGKKDGGCNVMPPDMVELVDSDGMVFHLRRMKSSPVLAFMILPCVLSACVLLALFSVRCMDRRRAEDKLPLYKHIEG
ncbi:hypothetical protein L9F63_014375 [Diploptera punctata]|uniref:Uncharacterized protein n=1 Tax=Diploptera punctata TaxID=6984 RepID=A0AAD8A808_DIPPU|nr:hypothetical protein L9F63_014375 [Diploptera punctata]